MTAKNSTTMDGLAMPISGLVSKGEPSETLYNVYNSMDALIKIVGDREESCADWGVTILLRECMSAIEWEAARLGETGQEIKKESDHE